MLTYLTIGVSVQVAWFIFTIIRKLPSLAQVEGLTGWATVIVCSAINIALWPVILVVNLVASYHADLLKE